MNIISAIEDPRFFRPVFRDLATWKSWFVLLKAMFGLPLVDQTEKGIFTACTELDHPPQNKAKEAYIIAGRRSGKSFMAAVIAVFLATFKDWKPYLAPGEKGWIFIIATDRDQAKIIKRYISAILDSAAAFRKMVVRNLEYEIDLSNNINIAVKTCNFRSIRGYTVLAAICEEIAFWKDENSANPAQEVLAALRPALSTIPESMLIAIFTPYSRSGVLWEQFKAYFGKEVEAGPLIWKAPTRIMNPNISIATIENEMRDDPERARAEWEAEWREDIQSFLSNDVIEGAIIPGRYELPKSKDAQYFGYVDPSGGRHDSFALAICHREERERIVLDCIREIRPPFSPQSVVREFSKVLAEYEISYVECDRYSAEWVVTEFGNHGITVGNSEGTSSELFLNFLPLIMNGSIELLDNKRLADQLRGLERKTRSGGKDMICHGAYSGAHDDVAVAVAGACDMASRADADFLQLQECAFAGSNRPSMDMSIMDDLEWRSTRWLLTGELLPPIDERIRRSEAQPIKGRGQEGEEVNDIDQVASVRQNPGLITRLSRSQEGPNNAANGRPQIGEKKEGAWLRTIK